MLKKRSFCTLFLASVLAAAPYTYITAKEASLKTITEEEFSKGRPANFYSMLESKDTACQEILDELNKPYKSNVDFNHAEEFQSTPESIFLLGSDKSIVWSKLHSTPDNYINTYRSALDVDNTGTKKAYYIIPTSLDWVTEQGLFSTERFPAEEKTFSIEREKEILQEVRKGNKAIQKNYLFSAERGEMPGGGSIIDIMHIPPKYYALATLTENLNTVPGVHFIKVGRIDSTKVSAICKFKKR